MHRDKFSINPDANNQFRIPITVTKEMAPSSRVVCFYVQGSGELIYDQLVFNVEPARDHKVSAALIAHFFY